MYSKGQLWTEATNACKDSTICTVTVELNLIIFFPTANLIFLQHVMQVLIMNSNIASHRVIHCMQLYWNIVWTNLAKNINRSQMWEKKLASAWKAFTKHMVHLICKESSFVLTAALRYNLMLLFGLQQCFSNSRQQPPWEMQKGPGEFSSKAAKCKLDCNYCLHL